MWMSRSTTSDRVISESRYSEVFYYVTNGTVMTKNVYFHDNVMFIPKTCPGLTISVLVHFSLRSCVFLSSVGHESCPRSHTLATARLYRSLLWHHVVLVEVVVGHHLYPPPQRRFSNTQLFAHICLHLSNFQHFQCFFHRPCLSLYALHFATLLFLL